MMFEHLSIGQLSDLIDDSLSLEEKALVLEHIRICETCRYEYESLNKCVVLMSGLRNEAFQIPDISEKTILICKARERKRLYIKSIPAIAASVMIIAGAGFIKTGLYPENSAYMAANLPLQNETEIIINAIRDSNGRIMSMTSDYIDGEIDNESLASLENYLQKNRIKHSIVPVQYINSAVNKKNITATGVNGENISGNGIKRVQIFRSKDTGKVTVRFFK
ncbi:MAG TPA: zf-HC2 domain-containing protein [Spirochaetota bacterium]|nr:zf-HC2 domain-containing protein [Spirochaetota bacterium]